MLQSVAPGSPPDDPVRGLGPCSTPPQMLQSGASFCRIPSITSDAPVRGTGFNPGRSSPGASAVLLSGLVLCFFPPRMFSNPGLQSVAPGSYRIRPKSLRCLGCSSPWHRGSNPGLLLTPGRSSPGASAVLHSAPDAPIRGVFLSYSLRCLGRSSPWQRVHPRTIQSGGLCRAPLRPGFSNPGRLFVVFSPLPQMFQSVAPGFPPGPSSPGACAVLQSAPDAPIRGVFLSYSLRCLGCSSPWHLVHSRTIQSGSGGLGRAPLRPKCSDPGRLFVVFPPLPRTLQSVAPGSTPDDPVRGLVPCFFPPRISPWPPSFYRLVPCSTPPRMLQSGASFYRILSVALDAPVRGTGFSPGPSSPGACAVLHSAPDAPIRGVFLSYPLRCLGRSSPWHRVLPRTIQSGGLGRAPLRPRCSNPGRLFVVFPPLPRTLQSVAPGSTPDDPVRGLVPCFFPPRMLQSGASSYRILSVASDAPVRGTWLTPGRSSPGASAVLHSAPDAPIRGVFLSYSLRCLGRSSPWQRVHPRTIQSGGLCRAPLRPGFSNPGRLFVVFSPLPQMFQSVAPGSLPDHPVRGLVPCSSPPRMLQSGASFCRILSVASDAPVRGTGFNPGRSSPGASAVLLSAPDVPIQGVFLSYSLRCLRCSSPWHRVLPQTIQSGGLGRAPLRPKCSNPGRLFVVFPPLPRTLLSVAPGSTPDDPVRGLVPCFFPPRMLQSGASSYRILSVASDAPVRGTWFTPGRSSPGASAVLHSAPDAPIRGVFLSYSLRCLGRSSPWQRVHPRTIQSGGLCRAPLRPGFSNPGRLFVVFSPLPQMFQSVAPGSPPDHPVRGLVPCSSPPRMLQSGASFCRILSVASDAPVRGTWFTPGRSSPGASAVLHSAPDAPIRGVFLSYSVRCLRCSSPWHRVLPRTIQSGGLCRAPLRPGCSNPGRLFVVSSPLPRTLQSVAPGSPPNDPVRGLGPCSTPPQMLQSAVTFCRILSVASDAPVRGTGFNPGRSSPGASGVLLSAPDVPIQGVFLSYSLRCLGCSSPWHLVHPRAIQSGG